MADAFIYGLVPIWQVNGIHFWGWSIHVLTVITASCDVQHIVALNHDKGLTLSTL